MIAGVYSIGWEQKREKINLGRFGMIAVCFWINILKRLKTVQTENGK